jgi:hypothetical protein
MSAASIAKWREERRVQMAGHHGINAYHCRECGANTVTIDVDPGVTPMFLACRRTPGCKGTAVSSGYPATVPPQSILDAPRWEWFLPKGFDYAHLSPEMRQFIDDGGLELRPWTGRPSAYQTGGAA